MKRSSVTLEQIAAWHNLASAFGRAAAGAGSSAAVEEFRADLYGNLERMQRDILQENIVVGKMTSFCIRDPKTRIIHAPAFRERVLHHAIMAHVGPVLDKSLVDDTFACRKGKGGLAAVQCCRQHLRCYPWYVQIDISGFFAAVDHEILLTLLGRKMKNPGLLRLLRRIVQAYETEPGRGLPIRALTSQHCGNYYLSGLDRFLLEGLGVRGMVRYMDDVLWCCDNKEQARRSLLEVREFIAEKLNLNVKEPPRIGPSSGGTLFCGYRILPGRLLLSRRRKHRYVERRRYWERFYEQGVISGWQLQRGYDAVFSITAHADAASWRGEQLRRHPLSKVLEMA